MRTRHVFFPLMLLAVSLRAETDYTARKDIEERFNNDFGRTGSWRTWTDHGTVLRSLIGKTSSIPGARQGDSVVRTKLQPYLGGLQPMLLRLDDQRSYRREDEAHYEYTQLLPDGRPVENTLVIVDINRFDQIVGVVNQSVKDLRLLDSAPLLSERSARCFAVADFLGTPFNCDRPALVLPPGQMALVPAAAERILYAVPPFAREAWAVELKSMNPLAVRRYVIDARHGFILEKRDRVYHLSDPDGYVFNPSPLSTSTVKSIRDVVDPPAFPPYVKVPLANLSASNSAGERRLTGLFVNVIDRDHLPNVSDDIVSLNDVFEFSRGSGAGLASVMAYYHIDAMQSYIQRNLMLTNVAARPIEVDVRGYPFDLVGATAYTNNAYGTGVLTFGYRDIGKPLFIAEDGDVIAHEYGHALQASQAKDRYDKSPTKETRAMAEGFADYWAFSYFAWEAPSYPPHLLPLMCFGAWVKSADGVSGCMRSIDPATTITGFSKAGDDYDNAQVWTAALWALRSSFPQQPGIADRMILRSHLSVHDGPSFVEGVRAIFTADEAQNPGADHHDLLCSIFTGRGIIKPEECEPLPPDPIPAIRSVASH